VLATLSGHGDFFNFHLFLIILHFLGIASKSKVKNEIFAQSYPYSISSSPLTSITGNVINLRKKERKFIKGLGKISKKWSLALITIFNARCFL